MPVHAPTTSAISSGPTSLQQPPAAGGFFAVLRILLRFDLLGEVLSLEVEFVELLVIVFADGRAGRLLFLDRRGKLVVLQFHVHQLLADLLHVAQAALFEFPLPAQLGELFAQVGHFLLHVGPVLLGVLLAFLGKLAIGQFELHQPPLHLVDFAGHAFQFHRQPAGGLVHQVDGLVGQEAVGDVAVRKVRRRHQGRVLDPHAFVMGLIPRLQTAEDRDRVLDRRLADHDRLEAAFQRGVLFDVFSILVERRGADAAEFAPGQGRLQEVGRVAAALGLSRADDRVQLVDEKNDVARVGHLAEHGLEPLLELAAELRPGHQGAHVEAR